MWLHFFEVCQNKAQCNIFAKDVAAQDRTEKEKEKLDLEEILIVCVVITLYLAVVQKGFKTSGIKKVLLWIKIKTSKLALYQTVLNDTQA